MKEDGTLLRMLAAFAKEPNCAEKDLFSRVFAELDRGHLVLTHNTIERVGLTQEMADYFNSISESIAKANKCEIDINDFKFK
ncbi:Uncharacterised protein [Burkholderia pseudomallei]|uniref:hypothetical protein n=1 Tax=Burkholderia pseudomallei TaxID=28450 RepID=UPI0005E01D05|nr:hypothetical protein [Burkholderia pseudomallei]CAK1332448.1 Uncharacterised protein [Burkholderia pseudomallei]